VLISFVSKAKDSGSDIVEYSAFEMEEKLGISRNTIKSAITELMGLGMVIPIEISAGRRPNRYKLTLKESETPVKKPVDDGWMKAAAARKKKERDAEIAQNIKDINFDAVDILKDDINSLSILNSNIFMTEAELAKLSNRIVKEYLLRRVDIERSALSRWFVIQNRTGIDLLVKYRTEQVIAGIKYWTEVKPNGKFGLGFLKYERNMMKALDYYKAIYLSEKVHEVARQKSEELIVEIEAKKQAEQERMTEEKNKVESMSDDDFVKNLLGGFGKINVKRD
jgi:hypothetical protein